MSFNIVVLKYFFANSATQIEANSFCHVCGIIFHKHVKSCSLQSDIMNSYTILQLYSLSKGVNFAI